jgi:hypothetical protein
MQRSRIQPVVCTGGAAVLVVFTCGATAKLVTASMMGRDWLGKGLQSKSGRAKFGLDPISSSTHTLSDAYSTPEFVTPPLIPDCK